MLMLGLGPALVALNMPLCIPASSCRFAFLQGPIHTALTVAREEGVMKLWSGATATTIRQGRCGACAEL